MNMNRAFILVGILVAVLIVAIRYFAAADDQPVAKAIASTFDQGDEGWLVVGDAQGASEKPTYEKTDGNPGGHLSATDDALGGVWYWQAPQKFLGDRRGSQGKELSFDLAQSEIDSPFDDSDVILESGAVELVFNLSKPPGVEWTHYVVPLTAAKGWKKAGDESVAATEEDLKAVLKNLTRLHIRGEYRTGSDVGRLDNVVLGE